MPTRKRLGEYYTPDWLAEPMVETVIDRPLETRVLDPACGSGTFLFHAVRRYLAAAEAAGVVASALSGLTRHVLGMDLHPVAVTLARVTYLLAIGRDRLTNADRGPIQVPVYLGDASSGPGRQMTSSPAATWSSILTTRSTVRRSELRFPDELLEDPGRFDQIVESMTNLAGSREARSAVPKLSGSTSDSWLPPRRRRWTRPSGHLPLHDEGRDHIWSYYVRNLARPLWLARGRIASTCWSGIRPGWPSGT